MQNDNDKYISECKKKDVEDYSKDLDQWLRKMKCTGVTGVSLTNFADVKVGVNPEKLEPGSPGIEPYPRWTEEKYTYKGYKDANGKLKGKVFIEFENSDVLSGT